MDDRPDFRTHWLPRTRDGWVALVAFLALFTLCMPPVTHTVLNRMEPWIFGAPFFYTALFFVYSALIGVLIWVWWRDL